MYPALSCLFTKISPKRLLPVICSVFLLSCEKVITLRYQQAATNYVIEGTVSNMPTEPATVKLSQTKTFDDDNSFAGISGAIVTIRVNNDSVYTLTETSAGIYQTSAFKGLPGATYTLNLAINGQGFSAVSTLPPQLVTLDTITVDDLNFGGSITKTIKPDYLDPAGQGNSYRFIEYANGQQVKAVFVQNDDFSDGLRITRPLIYFDADLKTGDLVTVNMLCIDKNVYKYWYSLDQASTGSSNSTPANPVSNITGGALGYFSAHSISSKTITIP